MLPKDSNIPADPIISYDSLTTLLCGSAISSGGLTSLPTWNAYVDGLLQALLDQALSGSNKPKRTLIDLKGEEASSIKPYQTTDVLIRRLGQDYLKVLTPVFDSRTAKPNSIHRGIIQDLLETHLRVVLTTNFDMRLELAAKEKESMLISCTFKGDLASDRDKLKCATQLLSARKGAKILIIAESWQAFRSITIFLPRFPEEPVDFRYLLKIHGSASSPETCIDSHLQRSQGLPAFVRLVLQEILQRTTVLVAGYSGTDLDEDLDYLGMVTHRDRARIRWMVRPESRTSLLPEVPSSRARLHRYRFAHGFEDLEGSLRLDKAVPGKKDDETKTAIQKWSNMIGPAWSAAALMDYLLLTGRYRSKDGESLYKDLLEEVHRLTTLPTPRSTDSSVVTEVATSSLVSPDATASSLLSLVSPDPPAKVFSLLKTSFDFLRNIKDETSPSERRELWGKAHGALKDASKEHFDSQPEKTQPDSWVLWFAFAILAKFLQPDPGHDMQLRLEERQRLDDDYERLIRGAVLSADVAGTQASLLSQAIEWLVPSYERRVGTSGTTEEFDDPATDAFTRDSSVSSNEPAETIKPNASTHVFILDLDSSTPAHSYQDVPMAAYLRAQLNYALLLRRRVLATHTIFNSRTLVMDVLCPGGRLQMQYVSLIDVCVWPDSKTKEVSARRARQGQIENIEFLHEDIPLQAMEPLLRYYDSKRGHPQLIRITEDLQLGKRYHAALDALFGSTSEDLCKAVGDDLLGIRPLPPPDKDPESVIEFNEKAAAEFMAEVQNLKMFWAPKVKKGAAEVTDGPKKTVAKNAPKEKTTEKTDATPKKPRSDRGKLYAFLKCAPTTDKWSEQVPGDLNGLIRQPDLLATPALKALCDAPYVLNVPLLLGLPILTGPQDNRILRIGELAFRVKTEEIPHPLKDKLPADYSALAALPNWALTTLQSTLLKNSSVDRQARELSLWLNSLPTDVDLSGTYAIRGPKDFNYESTAIESAFKMLLDAYTVCKGDKLPRLYGLPKLASWGTGLFQKQGT